MFMFGYISIYIYLFMYVHKYLYTCMYIYMYVYSYVYMCIYIYKSICIHIYVYMYIYRYLYIYIYYHLNVTNSTDITRPSLAALGQGALGTAVQVRFNLKKNHTALLHICRALLAYMSYTYAGRF